MYRYGLIAHFFHYVEMRVTINPRLFLISYKKFSRDNVRKCF